MTPPAAAGPRRALVLGGTGAVGAAVLRALRARDVHATFTWRRSEARAQALTRELGYTAAQVDLADAAALTALVRGLEVEVGVWCAGVLDPAPALETTDAALDATLAVNIRAPFVAARELARGMAARGRGSIVLVGALDRGQSLPIPPAFATAHAALGGLAMALAKEVGPRGVRVNVAALGLLDQGLSLALPRRTRDDYLAFSALRRFGTPDEAARAICWLALDDRFTNGKVLAVNGGI